MVKAKELVTCSWTAKFKYTHVYSLPDPDERLYELYEALIHKHKGKGVTFVEHIYEEDESERSTRHCHALVKMSKELYMNRFEQLVQPGFSIKIVSTGIPSWKKYMFKDAGKQGFHYGVSLKPSKLKEMCMFAERTYASCIEEDIRRLELVKQKGLGNPQANDGGVANI